LLSELKNVRKFDSRLQIEMLRALKPETFRTPGVHGGVNVHTGDQVLVLDEATRMKIIEARRKARLPAAVANGESQENVVDVTPSAPSE
jgi:hypothetical protein